MCSSRAKDPFRPITKLQISELALNVGVYIDKVNFGHKRMQMYTNAFKNTSSQISPRLLQYGCYLKFDERKLIQCS